MSDMSQQAFEQDALEVLEWNEVRRLDYLRHRHARTTPLECWSPPPLTEEQQKERDEQIAAGQIPF